MQNAIPWWSWAVPAFGVVALGIALGLGVSSPVAAMAGLALAATVFAAVYHAEIVAHRIGEPYGTLVLAVAVTIIEVALIVSVMLVQPAEKAGLARDAVYAAVMIVCNGIVGLCLLVGGVQHHIQDFHLQGARAALAVLAALTVLTLVVPNVTTTVAGPQFSTSQLAFAGTSSLILYGAFVFVQTVRHRDFFLPVGGNDEAHADPPSPKIAAISLGLLVVCLVTIVLLAKALTPTIEHALSTWGAPKAVAGIAIAALVLLPEGLAALRAAYLNRLQTSLNLALGSALASIGLTIPVVAALAISLGLPLQLGLSLKDEVLLALTLFLCVITLGTGRTTVLQGVVHLVVFFAFLFFALVP